MRDRLSLDLWLVSLNCLVFISSGRRCRGILSSLDSNGRICRIWRWSTVVNLKVLLES